MDQSAPPARSASNVFHYLARAAGR